MEGKLLTGQIRYQDGRRVRVTLMKSTHLYYKDADGFNWSTQNGERMDLKPKLPTRGTTGYWRDQRGQPLARLVLTSIRACPEFGSAAMKRFSHVAYLSMPGTRSRSKLMRFRQTKLFWIDEYGNKYHKTDLGCIDPGKAGQSIRGNSIKPLSRYSNGLIIANEGKEE